jgi:hypothetical protein
VLAWSRAFARSAPPGGGEVPQAATGRSPIDGLVWLENPSQSRLPRRRSRRSCCRPTRIVPRWRRQRSIAVPDRATGNYDVGSGAEARAWAPSDVARHRDRRPDMSGCIATTRVGVALLARLDRRQRSRVPKRLVHCGRILRRLPRVVRQGPSPSTPLAVASPQHQLARSDEPSIGRGILQDELDRAAWFCPGTRASHLDVGLGSS